MSIPQKLLKLLNLQVNREFFASFLYLSMAADFEAKNLTGFAGWMRQQSIEETMHGMKIFNFILARGEKVELLELEKPQKTWKTPQAAFEAALGHEKKVTAWIDELVGFAIEHKDRATESFLKWYIDEQVEEESQTDAIIQKLKLVGESTAALLFLDAELGKRAAPADISSK